MLLRSLHIASRQLFYLLVITIILGLLGLLTAVWLSDEVAKRKDEIAVWASQQTGYAVTIGEAGLYWFDLIPKLEVRQVELMQKTGDTAVATADQLYLSLDILATLSQGEPVVADASIRGAKLAVERNAEGQLRLTGLKSGQRQLTDTSVQEVIRWFTWLKQLQLANIELVYLDRQKTSLSGNYRIQQAELTFAGQQWQAEAEVTLPGHLGSDVFLSAQADISEDYDFLSWQGRLQGEQISLAPLLEDVPLRGVVIESGLASGQLMASRDQIKNITAEASLMLTDVTLTSEKTGEAFDQVVLDRMQGQLSFRQQQDDWQLEGQQLQMQMAGEVWPGTRFGIHHTRDGVLTAEADYLRLSDLTAVALLMQDMPDLLVATKPAGDMHDLSFRYARDSGLQNLGFRAEGIAMLPWQDYPGANDLSFQLDWQPHQGELTLDSHQTTIYADTWLQDAVYLESLIGSVSWRNQSGDWHLAAERLHFWNDDLTLSLNGRVNHQNEKTDTDIRLDMRDIQLNRWRAYVPPRVIPEDFEKWSREAFRAGVIKTGFIDMKGDLSAFPFDEEPQQGQFEMQMEVEDTHLHYAEGWPDLMNVSGTISGQGNNLLIKSQSGSIAGFAFGDVNTTISNLVKPDPRLQVDGRLNGSTTDALAFLQNSPLKKRFGMIVEWIQAEGKSDIQLGLMIPLARPNATEVSGFVTFADSRLQSQALPKLNITRVNGQLAFSNAGVTAEGIQAVALNEPVTIDVTPEDEQIRVDVQGTASVSTLAQLWPDVIPSWVTGGSTYHSQIRISEPSEGQFDVTLGVETDLRGVTIDAPAPLGKTASQRKTLAFHLTQLQEPVYRISFSNWFNAAVKQRGDDLVGQLMLGGASASATETGLVLSGELDSLNLDEWLDWQPDTGDSKSSPLAGIDQIAITLNEVTLAQQQMTEVGLQVRSARNQWDISINSPQVKGDITVPLPFDGYTPLDIRLDYLRISLPGEKSASEALERRSLWPAMRLDIGEFELDKVRLGHLNLRANRSANSWVVESASLESPVMQASLSGNWSQTQAGERSEFEIIASSDDLKAMLAYYGYQQAVEAQQIQINSQLNWVGGPADFSLASMQGKLDLTVGRGSLIEVEPGAAGRIFGLLSVAAIPRRLALDFSDLFGKGFDFSAITGKFQFRDGIARTDNLIMQGDSALIEVAGPVDMVNKTYDQIVKVTPKVSSALPLAGAVAGGPVGLGVGTAILIFDKLAGKIFDREIVNLISYSYQLTGPWDNPRLSIVDPAARRGQ